MLAVFIYIISVQYRARLKRKTLNRALKSTNYEHENAGAGLSYSGRNGQRSMPYEPAYLSRIGPYEVNQVTIFT